MNELLASVQAGTTPAAILADALEEQGADKAVRWMAEEIDRLRALIKDTIGDLAIVTKVGPEVSTASILRADGGVMLRHHFPSRNTFTWAAPFGKGVDARNFSLWGFSIRLTVRPGTTGGQP